MGCANLRPGERKNRTDRLRTHEWQMQAGESAQTEHCNGAGAML